MRIKEEFQRVGQEVLEDAKRILAKDGLALPSNSWLSGQWLALAILEKPKIIGTIDIRTKDTVLLVIA